MNATVTQLHPSSPVDQDAMAIGTLYREARASQASGAHRLLEAGRRLLDKRVSFSQGEWLPWLEDNAAALGFEHHSTADRLLQLGRRKFRAGAEFTDKQASEICLSIWGHERRKRKKKERCQREPGDENDSLTPEEADEAIVMIAKRLESGLFAPSPGILNCLIEAMSRASENDRYAIMTAADTLSQLVE